MKREIICSKCEPEIRKAFPSPLPYPGEHIKFVNGKAKSVFICDQCGQLIQAGDKCVAMSVWADYGRIPYYEWEFECLEEKEKKDEDKS